MQIARSTRAKIEVAGVPRRASRQAWARRLWIVWLAGRKLPKRRQTVFYGHRRPIAVASCLAWWKRDRGYCISTETPTIFTERSVFTKSHQFLGTFLDEDGEDPKDTSDVNDDTVHDNTSKEGQGSGAGGEEKTA